jgi:hypothetical protein
MRDIPNFIDSASAKIGRVYPYPAEGQDMIDEHQTDLDQADEDILRRDVSDEALEAAVVTVGGASARASCATWVPCC